MSAPQWTDDLSLRVARDETIDSLVDFLIEAERDGVEWPAILEVLTTRFALSFEDARLALDRVHGGRVRAATVSPANAPDPDKDPVAWTSYRRARGEPASGTTAGASAAWRALAAAASTGDGMAARAFVDTTEFATGASRDERDAAGGWRDAFDARGVTRGTDDVAAALRAAQLAEATLRSACNPMRKRRVLLQAATALSSAGNACIAARGSALCAPAGTQAWVDGVELAEASRRVAALAAELGDHKFESDALDMRGRIVTSLLGQCRARVGRAMLDSARCSLRAGDAARAADLCDAVVGDFAAAVDEWEREDGAPFDEHRLALAFLLSALDARIALGVASAKETRLRARCAAVLERV